MLAINQIDADEKAKVAVAAPSSSFSHTEFGRLYCPVRRPQIHLQSAASNGEVQVTLMYAVYRGAGATEVATGFCLLRCRDGCCLLGFARGLLPCAYVLLLVIISVARSRAGTPMPWRTPLHPCSGLCPRRHGGRPSTPAPA